MKTIYLIRHSKPEKNKQLKNEDIPLSEEGKILAYNLAKKLGKIDIIYSSTYKRAIETAEYISKENNIKINISSDFNERKLGTDKTIKEDFWLKQLYNENIKPINGESRLEVKKRMINGIEKILNNNDNNITIAIVSHATAITFLLMNWCKLVNATLPDK